MECSPLLPTAQTPAVRVTTHARMLVLMAILGTLDFAFLFHALSVSVQVAQVLPKCVSSAPSPCR